MSRWTVDEAHYVSSHCAVTADDARHLVDALEDALGELKYSALDHASHSGGDYAYVDAQAGRLIGAAHSAHYALWKALDTLKHNVESNSIALGLRKEKHERDAYNAARFVQGCALREHSHDPTRNYSTAGYSA